MSVVTFGEVMLRLSPPGRQRLAQASSLDLCFGGGEANVAVSLAGLGIGSRFVTALPSNELGDACLGVLRSQGVDVSHVARCGSRLGIYFLEHGASQRPSKVLYDRAHSAFADCDSWDWDMAFAGAQWFHFTGITPALSPIALASIKTAAAKAKELGLTVSCDLNYRNKLWTRESARAEMTELMPHVDVLFANEEDAEAVFGIQGSAVESGSLDRDRYVDVARQLSDRFGFKAVAITLRESYSASRNGWAGLLFDRQPWFSRHYEIDVVDRVGAGDAFAAGLIFARSNSFGPQESVEFAAAAGCLKHSIPGDFSLATREEVETLARGGGSGRVVR